MADPEINLLLLASRFEVRGSSLYTLRLAERLDAERIRARIVTPKAGPVEQQFRGKLRIEEYSNLDVPILGRLVLEFLLRDLQSHPPDLIHVQSRSMLSQGSWLAQRLERPYVVTIHDYLQPREKLNFDATWGRRIIAVSESVRSELLSRGDVADELVEVVRSGVDVGIESETLPVLEPGKVRVVGTAGPLEAVKGVSYFLAAAQKVLSVRDDVEFLVSGSGPEERNLRRLARELGINAHVTFAPNVLDFSAPLRAMDIFVLPSLQQGLGTIMLEAMALGKPVIATGVGGVFSVVRDGHNALVVPPSDSARLAERICELLDDPVRARGIGNEARRFVHEQFSADRMARETVELYRAVLAAERHQPEPVEVGAGNRE